METADVAAELRALAMRARRLLPLSGDPERFHIEKDELVHDINALANRLDPQPKRHRLRRPLLVTQVINGKRVIVQTQRKPFAIFVGGPNASRAAP